MLGRCSRFDRASISSPDSAQTAAEEIATKHPISTLNHLALDRNPLCCGKLHVCRDFDLCRTPAQVAHARPFKDGPGRKRAEASSAAEVQHTDPASACPNRLCASFRSVRLALCVESVPKICGLLRARRLGNPCNNHGSGHIAQGTFASFAPVAGFPFIVLIHKKSIIGFSANQEESVRLRRNQLCPIHRSSHCCGRAAIPKGRGQRQMGVRRIDDPQHPRGYREIRSNAEMRKLLNRKIVTQNGICALCKERFSDYNDVVPYADIGIPSPTTSVPAAWAAPGGMITPTTFRQCTGGATARRDRAAAK